MRNEYQFIFEPPLKSETARAILTGVEAMHDLHVVSRRGDHGLVLELADDLDYERVNYPEDVTAEVTEHTCYIALHGGGAKYQRRFLESFERLVQRHGREVAFV